MAILFKSSLKIIPGRDFRFRGQHLQQLQSLKTCVELYTNKQENADTKQKGSLNARKTQKNVVKITLIQNQNMTVTALEDAKHLAKRRSMHLIKVQDVDPKSQRAVYKLSTAAEMLQDELSATDNPKTRVGVTKKSEKNLAIGSRIGANELTTRLKNISKWLHKQHEVRVLIQATSEQDLSNVEKIFKTVEESVKTPQTIGKIVQKRVKNNIIKFNILPIPPAANDKIVNNSD